MITCLVCNKQFKKLTNTHLKKHNLFYKEYYDNYLKKDNEGICPICGKETKWTKKYYNKTCCRTHAQQYNLRNSIWKKRQKNGVIKSYENNKRHEERVNTLKKIYNDNPELRIKAGILFKQCWENSSKEEKQERIKKQIKSLKQNKNWLKNIQLSFKNPKRNAKIRKSHELNGTWQPIEQKTNWKKYKYYVLKETEKFTNQLKNIEKRGRTSFHVDHKYSICSGFNKGILPKIIGNIKNLEVIYYKDNLSKHIKNSITKQQLFEDYKKWKKSNVL